MKKNIFWLILLFSAIHLISKETNFNSINSFNIFKKFNIGFGGTYAFPFESNNGKKIWVSSVDLIMDNNIENNIYYQNIKNFDAAAFDYIQKKLKHSKFLVYWIVNGWQENWFDINKIQQAMNAGYIPVFNYWWFGDKLINGLPNTKEKAAYEKDNEKLANFLNKLKGTKFVIMEPEFNKKIILSSKSNQHKFASIISHAIDTIKARTNGVLFSLAMTDTGSRGENQIYSSCGYKNCALGDKYEWGKPSIIYNDLLHKLDFISFQEMIGAFSRNPANPGDWNHPHPIAYNDSEIGINKLAIRISNFAKFLKNKYKKPVFLPYIAIATATWNDTNNDGLIQKSEIDYSGWENQSYRVYKKLISMKNRLLKNGLFGFAVMSLFDNPKHDYGGYQFFMQNEYHLGIMKSSAIDEIDNAPFGDIVQKENILDILFTQ